MKLSTLLSILATLAICLTIPSSTNAIECPFQLLWTDGEVWAYRAVKCQSPTKCNVPSGVVLMYNHVVADTGCGGVACTCNLSDDDNDPIGKAAVAAGNLPPIHKIAPDKPVQNGSCSFIDAFNVPIKGTQTYYKCIEFRFKPDPAGPDKNLRVALELTAKPTTFLVNDDATYDNATTPKKLNRKVGGSDIEYEIIRSGRLLMPATAPATNQPNTENSGPEPATDPETESGNGQ